MKKELFYQVGFYSLIALIIGFIIGIVCPLHNQVKAVPVNIYKHDTLYIDSDSIAKKDKKTAYVLPKKPNDSVVYQELQRQGIKHPKIVLAQAKLETGNFHSFVCNYHHNLFGLMKGDKYHKFHHWKDSIKFYKDHVQSRYNGGDYYAFLASIGYAEDAQYLSKLKQMI